MTQKINGHVSAAEFIGADIQFFTVTATFSGGAAGSTFETLAPTHATDGSTTFEVDVDKKLLDVAVEAIQSVATPIIIGALASGNLSFKFASSHAVGTVEGGSTDPKATSFSALIDGAVSAALRAQGLTIAAGDVVIAVVKADVL